MEPFHSCKAIATCGHRCGKEAQHEGDHVFACSGREKPRVSYEDAYPGIDDKERVLTAAADMREMLSMSSIVERLKSVLGPGNYDRALQYLDVIDKYTRRLGTARGCDKR